jgi:Sulfotransferase family
MEQEEVPPVSEEHAGGDREDVLIRDPIIILAAPRSGSSLLLAALSSHRDLWSLYKESNPILEGPFHPRLLRRDSNALSAHDLDHDTRQRLLRAFFDGAGNLERLPFSRIIPLRGRGRQWYTSGIASVTKPFKRSPIRLVEKSPKNTLRIPFMQELFPDAKFLHLVREPRANIASLYGGWQDPTRHNTYPLPEGFSIRGYEGTHWCFVLQPGWQLLDGAPLVEVCADQWRSCNDHCVRELRRLTPDRFLRVKHEDLVADPVTCLGSIAAWARLDPSPFERFASGLPVIQPSSRPHGDDRSRIDREIDTTLSGLAGLRAELGYP